jgi:hypothetical protein
MALVVAFALYVGAIALELLEQLYVAPLLATIARLRGVP